MKCKEVKYFEYDGECFVARDENELRSFLKNYYGEELEYEIELVTGETMLSTFVVESFTYEGLEGSAVFYNATLAEIYKHFYKESKDFPVQLTYHDN